LVKWSCSWQGIKENLFSGVGTGDAQDYLQGCYHERNFWGQVFHYNSHNQFLQTGLTVGIFGMLILIFLLFFPLIVAYRKKRTLLFLFLLLVTFALMTESFFERQQGILFFCFFYSLLLREDIYIPAE
jgi:O-antigen ligase